MKPRVLVYGDVILDLLVTGEVRRDSPEAPGTPVLTTADTAECFPGGAANVACNVVAMGGEAMVAGIVGHDFSAIQLEKATLARGAAMALLQRAEAVTTTKTRFLTADGRRLLRVDSERHLTLAAEAEDGMFDSLMGIAVDLGAIVISDYAKGAVTPTLAGALIDFGRSRGIPVVVDAKQPRLDCYHGATVLKPNLKEIAAALSLPEPQSDEDAVGYALALLAACPKTHSVVLTRGEKGMVLVRGAPVVMGARAAANALIIPAHDVKAVDVTGAGDTVAAALALALARGLDIIEAARFANGCAAVVVTKQGTACPTLEEAAFFYDCDPERPRSIRQTMACPAAEDRLH